MDGREEGPFRHCVGEEEKDGREEGPFRHCMGEEEMDGRAVSYTHLTLPTMAVV